MQANRVRPTNPFVEFKKEEIEQSIPSRFEQMVERNPNRLAVKDKSGAFTYQELNQAANRIAHAILDQRGEGKEPIALLFEQSAQAIVAILGVLKAGNFYVPLEPMEPWNRLSGMLDDAQVKIIVTNSKNLPISNSLASSSLKIICMDDLHSRLSPQNPDFPISSEGLAYTFYTSGSTGRPKGVMDTHRNVLHNVFRYTDTLHIDQNDRLSLLQSIAFSGTVSSVFSALLNGASVFPLDLPSHGIPHLADWLIQEKITIYHSVPSLFRNLTMRSHRFPDLRLIRLEGDQAFSQDFEIYQKYFSLDCILVNGLGATECGLVRQNFLNQNSPAPSGALPVGYPVDDMEILLLGDSGQEVDPNRIGEIAVKSLYLSPGYWRQPELTNAAFLPTSEEGGKRIYLTGDLGCMSPDGCLVYLGRKDFRFKVRGHRVEVAEVELALLEIDTIQEAVVIAREDRYHDQRLVAYIVPSQGHSPKVGTLRQELVPKFPNYMIPSAFVMLDELPLTPTGKVDRRALSDPGNERPELDASFLAPRTIIEEKVSKIWAEVLGLEQVGINDPFLELGGDSLRATQVINRILDKFHVEISITILFEAPTVAEMSAIIAQHLTPEGNPDSKERLSDKDESLSDSDMPSTKTSKEI